MVINEYYFDFKLLPNIVIAKHIEFSVQISTVENKSHDNDMIKFVV